jgi:hypothetical protein
MLVTPGDERVADIYVGKFMRLWRHHRFRYIENKLAEEGDDETYEPNYLDPSPAWAVPYYRKGTVKYKSGGHFVAPLQ